MLYGLVLGVVLGVLASGVVLDGLVLGVGLGGLVLRGVVLGVSFEDIRGKVDFSVVEVDKVVEGKLGKVTKN